MPKVTTHAESYKIARRMRRYSDDYEASYEEVAEKFGYKDIGTVRAIIQNKRWVDENYTYVEPRKDIIVYKGEKVICIGTEAECALKTGYTKQTLRDYKTPSHLAKFKDFKKKVYVTAERKYDRRKKKEKDKTQIYTIFENEKPVFKGTLEESMEFTGKTETEINNIACMNYRVRARKWMFDSIEQTPITVYNIEER